MAARQRHRQKRLTALAVLSWTLSPLCLPSPALADAAAFHEAQRLIQEGNGALQSHRYDLAALKFGRALRSDLVSQAARAGMSETVKQAASLIKTDPEAAIIVFHRAIFLAADHNAQVYLNEAIKQTGVNPASPSDRLDLARHARGHGDFEGSIVEYIAALSMTDLPHMRLELAEALRSGNMIDSAVEQYKAALQNSGLSTENQVRGWMGLASCLEQKQDNAAAEEAFKRAAEANRKWRQRLEENRSTSAQTPAEDRRDKLINEGVDLHLAKQYEQSIQKYEAALRLDPNNSDILCNMGASYQQLGNEAKAADCYKQALKYSPEHACASQGIASLKKQSASDPAELFRLGKYEEALAAYKRVSEENPLQAAAHFNMGACNQALARLDDAISEYRLAASLDKSKVEYANSLAVALEKKADPIIAEATAKHAAGDLPAAIKLYQAAVALVPDNSKLLYNLASAFMARQQYPEAERTYQKVIDKGAKPPEAYFLLGELLENRNDGDGALLAYRNYVKAAPQGSSAAQANTRIEALARDSGNVTHLRSTSELTKLDSADAIYNKAVVYQKERKLPEAISAYKLALNLVPSEGEYWYALATAQQESGDLDQAISSYNKAVELTPRDMFKQSLHACQRAKAEPIFQSALREQTAGTPTSLARAIDSWQKGLTICDDSVARLNLGKALQSCGKNKEALAAYRQALETNKDLTVAHFHLGSIHESLKQPQLAKAEYQAYLSKEPGGEFAADCSKRIKSLTPH